MSTCCRSAYRVQPTLRNASPRDTPIDAGVWKSLRPRQQTSPATPMRRTAIGSSFVTTASTSRAQIQPPCYRHSPPTPGLLAVSTATSASIFSDGERSWNLGHAWATRERRPAREEVNFVLADDGIVSAIVARFGRLIGLWTDDADDQ